MSTNNSWVKFSISRATAPDNEKLGIGRWGQGIIENYGELIRTELFDFIDVRKLLFTDLEFYNNNDYYTLTAKMRFDATYPILAKTHIEGLEMQLARALPETTHVDIEAIVIDDFTFSKEGIFNSRREASTSDLLNLSKALNGTLSLTTPWFEFLVNDKDLQSDTLLPVIEAQILQMEEKLAFAKNKPFSGQGGNKTHDQQTRAIFMNTASRDGTMTRLLRENVLDGPANPEDFIAELKAAREALKTLATVVEFQGKPPRLVPKDEVCKLATNFGPQLDRGRSQMSPTYVERTLSDFPVDTIHGEMLRYGMYLAAHLALEIREGAGGTVNILDLHTRLANELGAVVVHPTPSVDDDYVSSPTP